MGNQLCAFGQYDRIILFYGQHVQYKNNSRNGKRAIKFLLYDQHRSAVRGLKTQRPSGKQKLRAYQTDSCKAKKTFLYAGFVCQADCIKPTALERCFKCYGNTGSIGQTTDQRDNPSQNRLGSHRKYDGNEHKNQESTYQGLPHQTEQESHHQPCRSRGPR